MGGVAVGVFFLGGGGGNQSFLFCQSTCYEIAIMYSTNVCLSLCAMCVCMSGVVVEGVGGLIQT